MTTSASQRHMTRCVRGESIYGTEYCWDMQSRYVLHRIDFLFTVCDTWQFSITPQSLIVDCKSERMILKGSKSTPLRVLIGKSSSFKSSSPQELFVRNQRAG